MKARFTIKPNPVTLAIDGNIVYCQIALNAQEVTVKDPQTGESYKEWEADWNEFKGSRSDIDTDDVMAYPDNYLDFHIEPITESEQRMRDIEDALVELGEIIGGE